MMITTTERSQPGAVQGPCATAQHGPGPSTGCFPGEGPEVLGVFAPQRLQKHQKMLENGGKWPENGSKAPAFRAVSWR